MRNTTDRVAGWLNGRLRQVPVWPVYLTGAAWALFLFYRGATGGLGVEPIRALELELGRIGIKLLILGLAITPLRRYFGLNLMRFRRAIGVLAFFYVALHLLVWLVLDVQDPARIWADIVKRPYVTVGMAAFVLLVPLAATSNDRSVRWLGALRWRRLHRLVYPAVVLGAIHFAILVKGLPIRPSIYLAVIIFLLALRLRAGALLRRA